MAGTSPGASAPTVPDSLAAALTTRTRINHGVFMVGDELATVYSSRRGDAVSMTVGSGTLTLSGNMSARQARAMAEALMAAATATEAKGGAA